MDIPLRYQSSKTYTHAHGLSCCFRQWKAHNYSHCAQLHGYSLQVEVTFEGTLNDKGWVVDFGGLKPFKKFLEETFDHTLIIADDDPEASALDLLSVKGLARIIYLPATGCEAFAEYIFRWLDARVGEKGFAPNAQVYSVKVSEHGGNSAQVIRDYSSGTQIVGEGH